jgi:hypothetical protein
MLCQDCPLFDPDRRRCRDGKINPQSWEIAVEAANVFGIRALCPYNDHREALARSRGRPQEGRRQFPS